jgi:hypothetical protein
LTGTAPLLAQPGGHPDGAVARGRWERSRHLLAWPAVAAVLFACYLRVSGTVAVNSDGANDALQAWDMLHGNVLLHGWWLGDVTFYTTELPQYALLELALGLHSSVVHVAAAMTYTLVVLLAALLAQGKAGGTAGTGRALIAAGIMLAPQLGGGASILLLSPDHVGSTVPVLAAFLILDRGPRRWYVPVSVAALLAWALVADRVVLLTGILPLAAVCSARSYLDAVRQRRPWMSQRYLLSLAGAALASGPVAWLVQAALQAKGGYRVAPLAIVTLVSSVTQIPGALHSDAQAVLLLFGADFLAQPTWLLTGMALVHLAGAALAGGAVWIGARRWRELDLVSACLAVAVLINGAAYVLLTQFDVLGAHEIAAVLPFSAVLAGRLLGTRLARPRLRPLVLPVLACYLACLGYAVAQPPVPPDGQHLADWLAANHLRSGLATYWQASGTTLASGGHIQVSPVCATKHGFTAEQWESNASWYDPRRREASFLILGGQAAVCNYATAGQARSAFGPPARSYHVGPYTVLVWRRNLLTMIR